jgi:NAD+ kinase
VEQTLKDNHIFNAKDLLDKDRFKGRLKFWTNEMCAQRPQTFDIVLAV